MKKRIYLIFPLILVSFLMGYMTKSYYFNEIKTESSNKKVTGIGGIFFKSKDPKALRNWYSEHLGLNINPYGSVFEWRRGDDSSKKGFSQWSPFKETTKYFDPSKKEFMINYRVENIHRLLKDLKAKNVIIIDTVETFDYGKFLHIMDIEGNKIELWEPNDIVYEKMGLDMGMGTTK
jgi:predicted enzyme related to lactoylglutathione lyase